MVSAIDENYRGCHSYELAGGQKKAESDKKKRRKNEKRDSDNWRRQTEMGLNENYEAKTWDNWCKLESCQSSRELAELEKDTNWETCSTSRHQWRPIPSISHKKSSCSENEFVCKRIPHKRDEKIISLDLPVRFPSEVYQVASEPIFPIDRFPLTLLRCKTLPFNHIFNQTPNLYLYLYFYIPVFPSNPLVWWIQNVPLFAISLNHSSLWFIKTQNLI